MNVQCISLQQKQHRHQLQQQLQKKIETIVAKIDVERNKCRGLSMIIGLYFERIESKRRGRRTRKSVVYYYYIGKKSNLLFLTQY